MGNRLALGLPPKGGVKGDSTQPTKGTDGCLNQALYVVVLADVRLHEEDLGTELLLDVLLVLAACPSVAHDMSSVRQCQHSGAGGAGKAEG